MPWGVAAAAVGGLIAADGSRSAGNMQADAARDASAQEREMFNLTREDQKPFMDRGNQAGNRLQYLLGLSPGNTTNALTRDQLRAELLPQFTTASAAPQSNGYFQSFEGSPEWVSPSDPRFSPPQQSAAPTINDSGLNAAIGARLAQQQQQATTAQTAAQNDPAYGSLMRNFSASDLNADPVYQSGLQFGLDEGNKGINRMAAASGNSLSGATLKALQRHAIDYGSTKANESFNRFNTQQGNSYNRLAGIAGTGQTATAQVGSQAVNTGASMGQNALIGGMARGSSAIGQTNALTGAMNNIYGVGKKKGWWDTGNGNAFQPNANGIGGNPYEGFDAPANGGWGIE